MPTSVAALEAKVDQAIARLDGHIRECGLSNDRKEIAFDNLVAEVRSIKDLPMKAVRWLGTLVVGAAITQLVTVYVTNHESALKATQAVQAAQQTAAVTTQSQAAIQKQLTVIAAQTNSAQPSP